jgi:hypothetical protein
VTGAASEDEAARVAALERAWLASDARVRALLRGGHVARADLGELAEVLRLLTETRDDLRRWKGELARRGAPVRP